MDATLDTVRDGEGITTSRFGAGSTAVIIASIIANSILVIGLFSLAVNLLILDAREPFVDSAFLRDAVDWIGNIIKLGGVIDISTIETSFMAEELGRPMQDFVGIVVLIPVVVGIRATIGLILRKSYGRYLTLALHFGMAIISGLAILQVWRVFLSIEQIVDGIMANSFLLVGLPLAYGLFWLAGRLDEDSDFRKFLENAVLGISILIGVALILYSDVLGATNVIRVTGDPGSWLATFSMIIFGYLAYRMLHEGSTFGETVYQRNAWQGWLMLSPNIVGFLLFFAGPLILSLYLSFTDSTVGQTPNLNGIENYTTILSLEFEINDDPEATAQSVLSFGYNPLTTINVFGNELVIGARDTLFWNSLFNTILFCLMLIPLSTVPALALALVLNSKLPGVTVFRAIYFLPSVAAVVGTALIWRWLYDPTIGYFNFIISEVVDFLNNTLGASIEDPEIAWLTGSGVRLVSIVFLAAWQVVGFNTVLFLAGLQGIPKTLYEAAMIDGANRWQQFRNVTLPMLAPTTFFVVTTTLIQALQVFNEPYALFSARPLPVDATTSVYYIYTQGFNRFQFGYASAVAWLLFLFIFAVTFLQFRLQRNDAYDD